MGSPVKLYQEEMHNNLGFFATWLPADGIEVGDAGVLERGRFRRMASLAELGIECKVSPSGGSQDVQYTSSEGTKIAIGANANVGELAGAEIKIDFTRAGAFVFHAAQLRLQRIENRVAVGEQIVQAYLNNRWNKDWLVVEALHTADTATVIVSEDSSAGIVLAAKTAAIPSLMLADPKLGLSVSSMQGKIMHLIAAENLHPLYSCVRLRDPLFGVPSLQPVRGAAPQRATLERPALDELLDS